ncbi:hypothetical protein [Nocardia asiatica]|uniref:hypothetical protein n=1 Tax=Nocardia asiatica TaxID=209252 RepID=UPI002458854C|nr:hypothetical protein [Nocardia asiatica]
MRIAQVQQHADTYSDSRHEQGERDATPTCPRLGARFRHGAGSSARDVHEVNGNRAAIATATAARRYAGRDPGIELRQTRFIGTEFRAGNDLLP